MKGSNGKYTKYTTEPSHRYISSSTTSSCTEGRRGIGVSSSEGGVHAGLDTSQLEGNHSLTPTSNLEHPINLVSNCKG